jgi:hypothetical protein
VIHKEMGEIAKWYEVSFREKIMFQNYPYYFLQGLMDKASISLPFCLSPTFQNLIVIMVI